tara:strand:- start:354 stop:596 length:243 start_codon:yes stop_codon:yes gene_type:complete
MAKEMIEDIVRFDNIIYVGDLVETKYGACRIKKIELMPEKRHFSKCGINVNKMFTSMIDQCIIDLDNRHFVYGDEIERIG